MTGVTIPADAVRDLVAKAIVDSVTPEQREALVASAVRAALEPTKDAYGRDSAASALQTAFDVAASAAVNAVVRELLADDQDFHARLRAAASEKIRALVERDWEVERAVSEALAGAILAVKR